MIDTNPFMFYSCSLQSYNQSVYEIPLELHSFVPLIYRQGNLIQLSHRFKDRAVKDVKRPWRNAFLMLSKAIC